MFCNNRGKELKGEYGTSCGENIIEKSVTGSEKLWKISKCIGILSSIIALIGCFLPFVHNNFLGKNCSGTYVEDYGAVVVACFLAAMVFSFLGLYRNLTVALIGSILTVGVTFWKYTSLVENVTPAEGFYLVVFGELLLLLSVILGYLSHYCIKQSIVGNGCAIALAVIAGLGIYLAFHQFGGVINGEITIHNKSAGIDEEEIKQVRNIVYQYLQYGLDGDIDGMAEISMDEENINETSIKVTHQYVEYYDNVEIYVYQGCKESDYLLFICYDTKFYGVDTTTKSSQYIYLRKNLQKNIKILSMNKDLTEEWEYVGEVVEENQGLADEIDAQFEEKLENNIKLKETWEEIQESLQ